MNFYQTYIYVLAIHYILHSNSGIKIYSISNKNNIKYIEASHTFFKSTILGRT